MNDPITVAVVDDDPIVQRALTTILRAAPGIRPVAFFGDGAPAIDYASTHHVDVYLVDVRMAPTDGFTTTTRIRTASAASKVIILTSITTPGLEDAAKSVGAAALLRKAAAPGSIAATIRSVHEGTFDPDASTEGQAPIFDTIELTDREMDVLDGLRQGQSNPEIADNLLVSTSAVKKHVTALLEKLGAATRLEAVIRSVELGLVNLSGLDTDRPGGTTEAEETDHTV